jgi:MORN repeat
MYTDTSGYEGEKSKDGKWHGQGILRIENGDFYQSTWNQGIETEIGTYNYANGQKKLGWIEKIDEKYVFVTMDRIIKNNRIYDSSWIYSRNGCGTLTYPTGMKYKGEWKDDKRYGLG